MRNMEVGPRWGKLEQAKQHLSEALAIYGKLGKPGGTAHTHLLLGKVHHKAKNPIDARTALDEMTGFGIYSPISVAFDGALDLENIIARHRDDDRPVRLL